MSENSIIKIENLSHHFGVKPVLQNINLEIKQGEMLAVMGANGIGKSTLLKAIAGMLQPLEGNVSILGKVRRNSAEEELFIRKQVAYLPDHPWTPLNRTGREFLIGTGQIYDIPAQRLMDHVNRLLHLFNLEENGDSPVQNYSNGQKKKIAIASALVTEAPILILDEPFTGGLDPSAIHALKKVLKHLADRDDVTIIIASQIPEIVEALSHRLVILEHGKVKSFGTIEQLQAETNCTGNLEMVLEKLLNPETESMIDNYFNFNSEK
ncbi:MAG: ABC transporter ATP-binding protein [Opitutaceae bacterium]